MFRFSKRSSQIIVNNNEDNKIKSRFIEKGKRIIDNCSKMPTENKA